MHEETGLFEVRVNEQGKKYIRKFVAISYTILVLVFFEATVSIYWSVRMIISARETGYLVGASFYNQIYPYVSILVSLLALVSNFFYIRFPRALLRCIELNDEWGANKAFSLLFKGALIFLVWLLLTTVNIILTFFS